MKFPEQARYPPRKAVFLLAALVFFLIALPFLQGGGKKQDSLLDRADALIEGKRYDEAILVLTDYIRANPDDFDRAQERFQRIVGIRSRYNLLTVELLETVARDPDNAERILALTRQLESMESASNPQTHAFIIRTRDIAQFAYNRKRLEDILREGKELTLRGNYREALLVYGGGLDIYQEEFFKSGYGELIENRVRRDIAGISGGIGSFLALSGDLDVLAKELEGLLEEGPARAERGGLSRVQEIYRQAEAGIDGLADIQGNLYRAAEYFDELLLRLREADGSLGDRSFLSFASRLIRGRGGDASEDGMLLTVDAYWNSFFPPLESMAAAAAESWYRSGMARAENGDHGPALEDFQLAADYAGLSLAFLEKDRVFKARTGAPAERILDRAVPEGRAGNFLRSESLARALALLQSTESLSLEYQEQVGNEGSLIRSWQAQNLDSLEILAREGELKDAYQDFEERIEGLIAGTDREAAALQVYALREAGPRVNYIAETRALQTALRARINNGEFRSAFRQYTLVSQEMEQRLAERREQFAGAESAVRGARTDAGGTGPAPASAGFYPAEGLRILNRMEEAIEIDLETGRIFLARFEDRDENISGRPELVSLRAAAVAALNDLASLRAEGRALAADARNRIARAEALRQEGERYFQEARNAVAANNPGTARDRLERAAERYAASLAIQESDSLRTEWDTRAVALGADIHRRETETAVRELRVMVNAARNAYFAGDFDQAEELLVNAQNRWQAVNVADDPEVLYWLSIVRGALALRSDRVISSTAPLYPEMSQFLSAAAKNYEEGVRLINAGRRSEGLAWFDGSRYLIQKVKLMFPVNQEAGILELRIDQVTDPAAFTASFQRRLNDAIAGTKRRSLESFADLQNLAELNPRYPGIQNALIQAEIDMGRRPAPPDPAALARSSELAAAARRIVESNARLQFEVALQQLNEALILNPNNTQAMSLKDRVQTEMGGSGNIVLSSAAEGEYQRAIRELQQGNTLVALAIVERLLQDSRNRNSTRILELERRIHSVL